MLPNFRQGTKRKIGGTKRKNGANVNGIGKQSEVKAPVTAQINKVFCPECQGSGVIINGDGLEHANFNLSEMFKFKIKASDARREWMKSPEVLHNCSTGFHFPSQSEAMVEEEVKPMKLLHFYRVDV